MGAAGAFDKLVRRRADRDAASLKRRVVCALCNLAVKASAARVLAPALALAPATGHYAKRNLMAVNGPFQGLCRGAHASKSQLYFVDATGWPTTYPLSMFKKLDVVEVSARLGASHKETFGVCYVRRALRSPRVCALGCVVWRVLAPRASKLAGVC